jgi:hypothetical protein
MADPVNYCSWVFPWFCVTQSEWAAWTQAIGSILAIGLAVYVPWRQRSFQIADARKQEKLDRANELQVIRIMHIAMYQAADAFAAHCEFMQREFIAQPIDRSRLPTDIFSRPDEFNQFRAQLHLLGPIGHRVNKLIGNQDVIRGLHSEFLRLLEPIPPQFLERYSRQLDFAAAVGRQLTMDLYESICPEDKKPVP